MNRRKFILKGTRYAAFIGATLSTGFAGKTALAQASDDAAPYPEGITTPEQKTLYNELIATDWPTGPDGVMSVKDIAARIAENPSALPPSVEVALDSANWGPDGLSEGDLIRVADLSADALLVVADLEPLYEAIKEKDYPIAFKAEVGDKSYEYQLHSQADRQKQWDQAREVSYLPGTSHWEAVKNALGGEPAAMPLVNGLRAISVEFRTTTDQIKAQMDWRAENGEDRSEVGKGMMQALIVTIEEFAQCMREGDAAGAIKAGMNLAVLQVTDGQLDLNSDVFPKVLSKFVAELGQIGKLPQSARDSIAAAVRTRLAMWMDKNLAIFPHRPDWGVNAYVPVDWRKQITQESEKLSN